MIKEKLVLRKELKRFLRKALYTTIVFLIGMIITKENPSYKEMINKTIYKDNTNYMKIKNIYNKFFNTRKEKTQSVFT